MSEPVSIVVADDHPILRTGLIDLIRQEADLDVVGDADTGPTALKKILELRPRIAILDISMPGLDGISLTRRIARQSPGTQVVILTLHEQRAYVKQALEAGARAYVLKSSAGDRLIATLRAVLAGGIVVDTALGVAADGGRRPRRAGGNDSSRDTLTAREAEVLKLIAFGHSTKEVAEHMCIGIKSVETFKTRACAKLQIRRRSEILRFALQQGWLAEM